MKRLSSVLYRLVLLVSFFSVCGMTVRAETSDDVPLSINTNIISKPTYMVYIPEKVEFGQLSKNDGIKHRPVSVSANEISNLYANQQKLVVSVMSENEYLLMDGQKKSKLAYTLYTDNGQTPIEEGKMLEVTGTAEEDSNLSKTVHGRANVDTSKIKKAGNFTDILTFTLALQEVDAS